METSADYDHLFKLLIIGDTGVGKSCLLLRYTEDTFNGNYICTIGVDFKVKTISINGKRIKMQIWDTAGQERFRTITSTYYRGAHGVIIVYDVCTVSSFLNVERWVNEAKSNADSNIGKMLIGNKADLVDMKQVNSVDAQKLAIANECLFLETSAKDNKNIDAMFEQLCLKILETTNEDKRKQNADLVKVGPNTKSKKKKHKLC